MDEDWMTMSPRLIALQFEPTNRCWFDCDACAHRHMTRPCGDMSLDMATSISEQAVAMGGDLVTNGLGEPLLWEPFADYLGWFDQTSPETLISIFIGLAAPQPLLDAFYEAVAAYQGRMLIAMTLHYAQGGKPVDVTQERWQRAEAEALRLRALDSQSREVHVAVLPSSHEQLGVADHFMGIFGPNGERVHCAPAAMTNWFGTVEDRNPPEALLPAHQDQPASGGRPMCPRPFTVLQVLWDGRCTACCEDVIEGEYTTGDLSTQTLREVWEGPAITALRHAFLVGRDVSQIAPCNKCG